MAHALSSATAGGAHLAPQTQGFISLAVADGPPLASFGPSNGQALNGIEKLTQEKEYLEEEVRTEGNFEEIIGDSAALRRVLKVVETVAATESTVLICGETGTGKELIARALHDLSPRRNRIFVKLNCAAIPMGLLESELFGHEKGAFTGAIAQRIGRFELAHQGTLFLDEIGDFPLELQPKLLRVLQEQEFERLGSTRPIKVNVRLVAASNRDLTQMVANGTFRSDLFYRLNVFPVVLPPLRQRREDIPLLVRFLAQKFARRMGRRIEFIPSKVMAALVRYPWPGNVRELENVIERAVILSPRAVLRLDPAQLRIARETREEAVSLAEMEREQILSALHAANWVLGGPHGAAVRLAMKRTTLQSRMKKLGISNRPPAARAAASPKSHPTTAATSVWVRNGKPIVTDGPFAETHELLGR